jgi:hypothetical protein
MSFRYNPRLLDRHITNTTNHYHVAWLERTIQQQQHKEEIIHLKARIERLERRLSMKEHQLKLILDVQQLLE